MHSTRWRIAFHSTDSYLANDDATNNNATRAKKKRGETINSQSIYSNQNTHTHTKWMYLIFNYVPCGSFVLFKIGTVYHVAATIHTFFGCYLVQKRVRVHVHVNFNFQMPTQMMFIVECIKNALKQISNTAFTLAHAKRSCTCNIKMSSTKAYGGSNGVCSSWCAKQIANGIDCACRPLHIQCLISLISKRINLCKINHSINAQCTCTAGSVCQCEFEWIFVLIKYK